jgi:hypothetical protein
MASPVSTFTEMVTTTLRNHKKELTDNVSLNNALLTWLKGKGHIKTESGGYEIAIPLDYAENSTYQRYSGYDTLNTSASDVLSAAKYDWSQAAIHVTASGRELKMNNGEAAMIKLVKSRVKNAMRTAANNMSVDLYSDGTITNQIQGLANMCQQAGTGTVGSIVSGTFTFWKNKFVDMTSPSATNIIGNMNTLWLTLVRGTDKPDLIVSSQDLYNYYESALQANQRYADSKSASAGFESLKYKTASVIFDSNSNYAVDTEDMYFLNTDYLYLIEHSEAKWDQDDQKVPVNQDAVVIPMYWMGQLVTSNRSLQGLCFDT